MQIFNDVITDLDELIVRDMKPCTSKTSPARAVQMYGAFILKTSEGGRLYGSPGDYLACDELGRLHLVEKDSFEKLYNWEGESNTQKDFRVGRVDYVLLGHSSVEWFGERPEPGTVLYKAPPDLAAENFRLRRSIERAITRARVFDDGSDRADGESAQSTLTILSAALLSK